MKKLKGFTLAEVLISLALIGVIAALTLPNLSVNVQKQQVPPALGKAMSTLESANRMILQESGYRTVYQACEKNTTSYVTKCLAQYVNGTIQTPKAGGVSYRQFMPQTVFRSQTGKYLKSQDGFAYMSYLSGSTATSIASSKYQGYYFGVLVDINGLDKGPNVAGKDLFEFYVDGSGAVIPYGGVEYKKYMEGEDINIAKEDIKTCAKNSITSGLSCTGKIFDDGMKVTYY
jgi:prepilin-type N-terminal cleavage/methylation domain-containing protein